SPDHPGDGGRRQGGHPDGVGVARRRHLRDRFLVPGRPKGPGADPDPDVGGPRAGGHRPGGAGVHRGRTAAGWDRMKALVKAKAEPGLWMEEVPDPQVGRNDVLIRVEKTSICGTDVHIYEWDEWAQATIPVPLVVGHEFMGRVEAVGDEVEGIAVG